MAAPAQINPPPTITIPAIVADDPAFLNKPELQQYVAEGIPLPCPPQVLDQICLVNIEIKRSISSLEVKSAIKLLKHSLISHAAIQVTPAIANAGIAALAAQIADLTATVVAFQDQTRQALHQTQGVLHETQGVLHGMQLQLNLLNTNINQTNARAINTSVFPATGQLVFVPSTVNVGNFPDDIPVAHRVLDSKQKVEKLPIPHLDSWIQFYGLPESHEGVEAKKSILKRFIGCLE